MSRAFRIGALLIVFAVIGSVSSEWEEALTNKAINWWMSKTFSQTFSKLILPPTRDVVLGYRLYNQKKTLHFKADGHSELINEATVEIIKEVLDTLRAFDAISSDAEIILRNILEENNFKRIMETVVVHTNGTIDYTIVGLVELKKSENHRTGAILWSFKTFSLEDPVEITYETPNSDDDRCMLWGQFCPNNFHVQGLTDSEARCLFSYMRAEAIKGFVKDNDVALRTVEVEAQRYRPFLPTAFENQIRKLERNPDTPLTKVFDEDPFHISKY